MSDYKFCRENVASIETYHLMKAGPNESALCGAKCEPLTEEVNDASLTAREWQLCEVCNEIRRQQVTAAATKAAHA
jgi:hypothetical protein